MAHRDRLVEEECPHVECNTVCADYVAVFVTEHRRPLMVDLKTNIVNAAVEEEYFVEFVQLVDEHDSVLLAPRLQIPQDAQHELLVPTIFPCVKCWLRDTL